MSTPGSLFPPPPTSFSPVLRPSLTETRASQQTAFFEPTVDPSRSQLPAKRGRPRGSKKQPAIGPRRPVGRPRGSGPKQRAKAEAALLKQVSSTVGSPSPPKKRPVGRPRKDGVVERDVRRGTNGRSIVSVEFGRFVSFYLFFCLLFLTSPVDSSGIATTASASVCAGSWPRRLPTTALLAAQYLPTLYKAYGRYVLLHKYFKSSTDQKLQIMLLLYPRLPQYPIHHALGNHPRQRQLPSDVSSLKKIRADD